MYNRLIEKNWVPIQRQEIILVCFGMSYAEHDVPFWKSG
jgi:hypothetical protein